MPVLSEVEEKQKHRLAKLPEIELCPILAFASIAAFFCSSLDITTLEYIDTLRLYMTPWEIVLEVGAALVILVGISIAWWIGILLFIKSLGTFPKVKQYSASLCWYFWLAFPFTYFVLELLTAARLRIFPRWHPGVLGSLVAGISLIAICSAGSAFLGQSKVQQFCRSHLSPLGWLHVAAGSVMLVILVAHGVRPYSDFAHVGHAAPASDLPDIYLISIDALRAQDISVYGYDHATTPNLERFAQSSFVFENFVANSNFTTPGTISIETGKLPWSHRVFQIGGFLRSPVRQENLAAELQQHGYYTASITSNVLASPFDHGTVGSYDAVEYAAPLGLTGMWMRYSNLAGVNGQVMLFYGLLRRLEGMLSGFVDKVIWDHRYPYPVEPVFDRARNLLGSHTRSQPVFLWTHILAPHDPYWPPIAYRNRFVSKEKLTQIRASTLPPGVTAAELRAEYDEMILYADHAVGEYLAWLNQTGRLDHAIVIITADHGESFEHDWFQHAGPYLYNGLIHIPLLIHLPGQRQPAKIQELCQQADLLPTVLDLIGGQVPGWTDGTSLKPALEGRNLPRRYVFSMALEGDSVFGRISNGTVAVMDNDFKYTISLDTKHEELFHYKTDQLEENNLIEADRNVASRMRDIVAGKIRDETDRLRLLR